MSDHFRNEFHESNRRVGLSVVVMALIAASQDIDVEGWPALMEVIRRRGSEGVAGGANAGQWFSGLQVRADQRHHLPGRRPPSNTDEEQVGFLEDREIGKDVVALIGAGGYERALQAHRLQIGPGELGQGFPGVVFILADDEYDTARLGGAGLARAGSKSDDEEGEEPFHLADEGFWLWLHGLNLDIRQSFQPGQALAMRVARRLIPSPILLIHHHLPYPRSLRYGVSSAAML